MDSLRQLNIALESTGLESSESIEHYWYDLHAVEEEYTVECCGCVFNVCRKQ